MDKFKPSRTEYEVNGRKLVLVLARHKGLKAYWIEDEHGTPLTPRYFWNPDPVCLILESPNPR